MAGTKGKSGGARPVLPQHQPRGRKRVNAFTPRVGEALIMQRETIGEEIQPDMLVTVLTASENETEYQHVSADGKTTIFVIRRPNENE